MRVTRVHVDLALIDGDEVTLPEAARAHLARVLRLREGDACVLFNGDGRDWPARITSVGKREVRVRLGRPVAVDRESPLSITVVQGVARGEKMDLVLQKATELGVSGIVPVFSERSEVKLDDARTAKRLAHWRSVVGSACEQSGRGRVPAVSAPSDLAAGLANLEPGGMRLLLDPDGPLSFGGMEAPDDRAFVLAVGPEGGWSPRDRAQLAAAGFCGVRLGPRILRTETAALAAVSALQARFGDLSG
ncbi:16S rRNA (uracil(1498)-N(3))-methyltransferase [Lysobacter sp. A3-1-A15]|uniref:16S rRNA (uracil(1498)-N(3))-methyltransferase n=1 Tax=Novilysobacter viscosus TaxID=3098602 RepID=UPI002ED8EC50